MTDEVQEKCQMDFLGEIVREPDPPGIDRGRWSEPIREHPNLLPPEPRRAVNPFTIKTTALHPRPDVAQVVVDGGVKGTRSWAQDDSNRINVFGKAEAVIPLAQEIAESLGGRFRVTADRQP